RAVLGQLHVERHSLRLLEGVGVDEDRPGAAVLALEQLHEVAALLVVGTVVDVGDRTPAAFVDGARPLAEDRAPEAVEADAVPLALLDDPHPAALAMPCRGPCVVVARTPVV